MTTPPGLLTRLGAAGVGFLIGRLFHTAGRERLVAADGPRWLRLR